RHRMKSTLLLFAILVLNSMAGIAAARQPNIILILTDDQGYADIGVYGAKGFATPNIDRLASQGIRFTDFHVPQAVCSASRAGLLTGCYPNRVGITGALDPDDKIGLHADEMTLPQMLKQKGYATGMVGKWHLGRPVEFLPTHRGFDEFFGLPYSNDEWPFHPEKPGFFPPLPLFEGDKIINPGITEADMEQLTTQYTEHALKFIEHNKDKPFFLYVAHTMPHVPLAVSNKFRGKTERGLYGDACEEIDWSTGEIMAALARHGLEKDTLVMFMSDNGPWLIYGDHAGSAYPLREGKTTSWEGGTRVPFIARWPGHVPAGVVNHEMAMSIDLMPTIAKLTGAKLPDHKIDGLDIWPLLSGQPGAKNPHEAYFFYGVPFGAWVGAQLESVRSGPWKLVLPHSYRTLGGGAGGTGGMPVKYKPRPITAPELYQLNDDVSEEKDVAADNPAVLKRLLDLAERCRDDLGDLIVKRQGQGVRPAGKAQ
ncbi:MAG: atsA 3, partial [Verrucomicrobiaceae bacterium]|nr:atsA 3 [Verrucomicrobiaceae bacterium]